MDINKISEIIVILSLLLFFLSFLFNPLIIFFPVAILGALIRVINGIIIKDYDRNFWIFVIVFFILLGCMILVGYVASGFNQ